MPGELSQVIAGEVARAEADYKAVRERSLSIVGVAGGLVTLVTGLLAIAAGTRSGQHLGLPPDAYSSLICALVAFVLAAICALLINLPATVTVFDVNDLKEKVDKEYDAEGVDRQASSLLVDYLGSLRTSNNRTAWLLTASIFFEILGIGGTAVAAILIVTNQGST